MTEDKTKEGQAAVIETPYRQPAGNLANEKFRLRCGVASCCQRVGEIYPCRVVVRHAENTTYRSRVGGAKQQAVGCRPRFKKFKSTDKRTSGPAETARQHRQQTTNGPRRDVYQYVRSRSPLAEPTPKTRKSVGQENRIVVVLRDG